VPQHSLAQLRPCSQEPGLRGRHCDPQPRGEILHRQLFHVAHHDHIPQQRRNSPDFGPQDPEHLALAKCAFRVSIRCWELDGLIPTLRIAVI
jgi:hypothetical protein